MKKASLNSEAVLCVLYCWLFGADAALRLAIVPSAIQGVLGALPVNEVIVELAIDPVGASGSGERIVAFK